MKKTYNKPKIARQGNVEEITQKHLGLGDAFLLSGSREGCDFVGNAS
jgi:hypothetical protein